MLQGGGSRVEHEGFRHWNDTHTTEERGALFLAIGKTQLWVGKRGDTSRPSAAIVRHLLYMVLVALALPGRRLASLLFFNESPRVSSR